MIGRRDWSVSKAWQRKKGLQVEHRWGIGKGGDGSEVQSR